MPPGISKTSSELVREKVLSNLSNAGIHIKSSMLTDFRERNKIKKFLSPVHSKDKKEKMPLRRRLTMNNNTIFGVQLARVPMVHLNDEEMIGDVPRDEIEKTGHIRFSSSSTSSSSSSPSSSLTSAKTSTTTMLTTMLTTNDVIDLSCLVKQFFRQLPEPLITFKVYNLLVSCWEKINNNNNINDDNNNGNSGVDDKNNNNNNSNNNNNNNNKLSSKSILHVLLLLPPVNLSTLKLLSIFLHKVSQQSCTNKMDSSNLAVCFAPSILKSEPLPRKSFCTLGDFSGGHSNHHHLQQSQKAFLTESNNRTTLKSEVAIVEFLLKHWQDIGNVEEVFLSTSPPSTSSTNQIVPSKLSPLSSRSNFSCHTNSTTLSTSTALSTSKKFVKNKNCNNFSTPSNKYLSKVNRRAVDFNLTQIATEATSSAAGVEHLNVTTPAISISDMKKMKKKRKMLQDYNNVSTLACKNQTTVTKSSKKNVKNFFNMIRGIKKSSEQRASSPSETLPNKSVITMSLKKSKAANKSHSIIENNLKENVDPNVTTRTTKLHHHNNNNTSFFNSTFFNKTFNKTQPHNTTAAHNKSSFDGFSIFSRSFKKRNSKKNIDNTLLSKLNVTSVATTATDAVSSNLYSSTRRQRFSDVLTSANRTFSDYRTSSRMTNMRHGLPYQADAANHHRHNLPKYNSINNRADGDLEDDYKYKNKQLKRSNQLYQLPRHHHPHGNHHQHRRHHTKYNLDLSFVGSNDDDDDNKDDVDDDYFVDGNVNNLDIAILNNDDDDEDDVYLDDDEYDDDDDDDDKAKNFISLRANPLNIGSTTNNITTNNNLNNNLNNISTVDAAGYVNYHNANEDTHLSNSADYSLDVPELSNLSMALNNGTYCGPKRRGNSSSSSGHKHVSNVTNNNTTTSNNNSIFNNSKSYHSNKSFYKTDPAKCNSKSNNCTNNYYYINCNFSEVSRDACTSEFHWHRRHQHLADKTSIKPFNIDDDGDEILETATTTAATAVTVATNAAATANTKLPGKICQDISTPAYKNKLKRESLSDSFVTSSKKTTKHELLMEEPEEPQQQQQEIAPQYFANRPHTSQHHNSQQKQPPPQRQQLQRQLHANGLPLSQLSLDSGVVVVGSTDFEKLTRTHSNVLCQSS
ncbi:hypothetical protein HELRODRAFT_179567 [Helobdella robusta]|uniref:Rho-GAP domain-containing protein n=1 Tax=Helobdella robusta TaxID=6412 RepID=T1FEV8_HELRO|nr:hypothetical protein HELRODRAFT_179567 [Helobdella robusta]ESN95231.1 hypothetical protein HELRODRAFT_179567 [Helobdella robusta]